MDRIVLVTKPPRLEELVAKHLTLGAAKFILETRGESIAEYEEEARAYHAALSEVRRQIPGDMPIASVSREDLPNFLFRDKDLIVVCGSNGLFANLAKYVGAQPVITVNTDPATIAGVLMLFSPDKVGKLIAAVREGKHSMEKLPFVKSVINDDKIIWGINDIFIGRKDHISARYKIDFDGSQERQSSSGIIVSTGVGSTGWIRSIQAMLAGLVYKKDQPNMLSALPGRTSSELVFVVREPFPSPKTGVSVVTGRITPESPLTVFSQMAEGGYIFSDGVIEKALEWNSGSKVVVSVGDRFVNRVVG